MSLVMLTGPVRSGKSALAERMVQARADGRGLQVVVAVAGWAGDAEMARRVERHRSERLDSWRTLEVTDVAGWLSAVPSGAVLLLDCLGTLVSNACVAEIGEAEIAPPGAEERVQAGVDELVAGLLARTGDTVVVSNEVGWGIVPAWPSARVFRDVLGRANRALTEGAGAAYLVVDGRCLDLKTLPTRPTWPHDGTDIT